MIAPQGWIVVVHKPSWHFGPFGRYAVKLKRIDIYPPRWIPKRFGLRSWWIERTRAHELAHAWGIKGCKRPWCLMFELQSWKRSWKDSWLGRFAIPFQATNRFKFCASCEEFLHRKDAF